MDKKMELMENMVGGFDLLIEKDSGNEVRILTGNRSLKVFKQLRKLCDQAIAELEG